MALENEIELEKEIHVQINSMEQVFIVEVLMIKMVIDYQLHMVVQKQMLIISH
jgi:hypothetical protein